MVDTNRSGTVDFNECTQCLHQIGYRLSPQTIVALMRAHDVDGNGYLQYDEFIALNAELSILTAQFQRYDVRACPHHPRRMTRHPHKPTPTRSGPFATPGAMQLTGQPLRCGYHAV